MKLKALLKHIVACTMVIALTFNAIALYSSTNVNSKISETLAKKFDKFPNSKQYVYIWYNDIDEKEWDNLAYQKYSFTIEEIEAEENRIPDIDSSIFDKDEKVSASLIKEYISKTADVRNKVNSMVDEYIMARRKAAEELYCKHNSENKKEIGINKEDIVYSSKYSPVTIAKLSKNDVYKIAENDMVSSIEYRGYLEIQEESYEGLSAIDADYVRNTLGFTGNGVKVGVIDGGKVGTHTELSSTSITRLDASGAAVDNHSTNVVRIIAGSNGVAPDCSIYSISSYTTSEQMIETLISNGVAVISMSVNFSRETGNYYEAVEKWFDHIAYQHNVSLAVAAGNEGNSTVVNPPGLAFNLITVGAYSTNNTASKTDDYFETYTNTGNGGQSGCAKPDVIAPTEDTLGGGTSMATPYVSGVIAAMCEYKPTLKTKPALVKAALTASCDRKFTESLYNGLTAKEGSGSINAKRAIQILSLGRYQYGNYSSSTITKTFSVTSSDTSITVGLSWLKPSSISSSSHASSSATVGNSANLKLQVLLPSGSVASSSNITNSSAEMVHFDVSTYGTYTIKITRIDSNTNSVPYALAWW